MSVAAPKQPASTAPANLLSARAQEIVSATAPVVAEHAEQITAVFYPKMFVENPGLLRVFNQGNQATGEQSARWLRRWSPMRCTSSTRTRRRSST